MVETHKNEDSNTKQKKIRRLSHDYILRYLDASIVLSSILAGYAILTTLRAFLDNFDIAISGVYTFIAFFSRGFIVIVTCIRFYHGNTAWHRIRYSSVNSNLEGAQVTATHLIDLYVHVIQYLLFAVVGYSIPMENRFFLLLAVLSFIDVVWTGLGWTGAKKGIMKKALATWFFINLITGIGALLVYFCVPTNLWFVSLIALLAYCAAAIADYLKNPELFFGIKKN